MTLSGKKNTSSSKKQSKTRPPLSLWKSLLFYSHFFKPYTSRVIWSLVFASCVTLPHLVIPVLIKVIIDHYIPARDKNSILLLLAVMGVMVGLLVVYNTVLRATYIRVVKNVSRDLRKRIIQRLQILSLTYFYKSDSGRYYSKIMVDVDRTEQFANVFINNIAKAAFMLAVLIVILAWVNFKILLIFSLVLPVFYGLIHVFKVFIQKSRYYERLARENLSIRVSQFLQTSLLARMHGHESYERQKVDDTSKELVQRSTEAEAQIALFGALTQGSNLSFHFVVVVITAMNVIDGEITIGEMMLFTAYVGMIMNQFMQLINAFPQITMFTEAVTSMKELLSAPDIEFNHGKLRVDNIRGEVKFENVNFAYDSGKQALNGINVDIPAGTSVALVGGSGSGKSTFVNLLLGLYRTQEGLVAIDDIPINSMNMRHTRHYIGVVSQNPIIFSGTIYENITHAYENTNMERVIDAAKKAHAHDFILELPQGYQTQAGENGALLSGGQCQRLSIARTILRNPRILILDEATSALDSESEKLVQDALDDMTSGITTFIIAHRLSTIRNADIILVFKDGEVVERGSHDELASIADGEYAKLLKLQMMSSSADSTNDVDASDVVNATPEELELDAVNA